MAWTLTETGVTVPFVFTFSPSPSSVDENWTRDIMDFDIPMTFKHMGVDWVTTDAVITIKGRIVEDAKDSTNTARSQQWWKNEMQKLLYRGVDGEDQQTLWELSDGNPDGSLYCWGNDINKKGLITGIRWTQDGTTLNMIDYEITFKVCTDA